MNKEMVLCSNGDLMKLLMEDFDKSSKDKELNNLVNLIETKLKNNIEIDECPHVYSIFNDGLSEEIINILKFLVIYKKIDITKEFINKLFDLPKQYLIIYIQSNKFVFNEFIQEDIQEKIDFINFIIDNENILESFYLNNHIFRIENLISFYSNYNFIVNNYSKEFFYKIIQSENIYSDILFSKNKYIENIDKLSYKDEKIFYILFRKIILAENKKNHKYMNLLINNFNKLNYVLKKINKPELKKIPYFLIENEEINYLKQNNSKREKPNLKKLEFKYYNEKYSLAIFDDETFTYERSYNLYYIEDFMKLNYYPTNIDGEKIKLFFIRENKNKDEPFISLICIGNNIVSSFPQNVCLTRDYPDVNKFIRDFFNKEKAIVQN